MLPKAILLSLSRTAPSHLSQCVSFMCIQRVHVTNAHMCCAYGYLHKGVRIHRRARRCSFAYRFTPTSVSIYNTACPTPWHAREDTQTPYNPVDSHSWTFIGDQDKKLIKKSSKYFFFYNEKLFLI